MASITANLTTITTCESVTGMVGNKPVLDADIKKEGSNSVGFTVTTNKVSGYGFTSANLSGQHCRMWYASITFPWMTSKATGGLRFYLKDSGGNYSYWNIGGNDTYYGGWINICVYSDSVPDSNSGTDANTTQIVEMGCVINTSSSPRNITNTWVDYLRYGDGLQVESATTESFGMDEIYVADLAGGYGIVEKVEGIYFLSGDLQIGDSTSTSNCYFNDSNVDIKFTDKNVNTSLYKIYAEGNSTGTLDVVFTNGSIKAAGESFSLDFTDLNINDFTLSGNSISKSNETFFSDDSGHLISNNTFNSCGEVFPDFASFTSNIVSDATGANGLVFPTGTNNVSYCSLLDNTVATLYTAAGTYYDDNNTYTNNIYDVENNSAGDVTVHAVGVSNVDSTVNSGGGTLTVLNTKQITMTIEVGGVGQTGYEWRLYEKNATPGIIGSVNLDGQEVATSSEQSYYYTYSSDTEVVLQIIHTGYEESLTYFTLENSNKSFSVNLTKEENI